MYSELIITYLFLGGASGGAFLVISLWSLIFHASEHRIRNRRLRLAFRTMKRVVYPVAFVMLLVSLACLFFDLKMPEKALLLFTRPRFTPLTFGAFALAAETLVGGILVIANVLRPRWATGPVKAALEIICVITSLAVMTYTAIYLSAQKAVALWDSPWLVPLFLCSSTSAGISTVLLCNWFVEGKTLLLRAARPLQATHLVILAAEAISLAAYCFSITAATPEGRSLALFSDPVLLQTLLFGTVGMGIAVPFALESYTLARRPWRAIPVSDVVCLIGGFCLRWCLIMGGTH